MSLPIYNSPSDPMLIAMETNWAAMLNPVLASPIATPIILTDISLSAGSNTINHTLGKNLTGWFLVRQRAQSQVWDKQDSNSLPQYTLILQASSAVTVDILVF